VKKYDSIIEDIQSSMQEKPSAGLRDRIINSAGQGITSPPTRRRMASILLATVIFALTATTVAATAIAAPGWRERFQQILQSRRAVDEGYVTYFYPLEFYFTAEMQEQQRRVAEMTILSDYFSEQQEKHISEALGLNLTGERDQTDAALYNAFSTGSVVAVRLDGTPLMLGPGFVFRNDPPPLNDRDILGILSEGTHVKITSLSDSISYLFIPVDSEIPIRAWHIVEVLEGEHAGRSGWLPNFLLRPSAYTVYDFDFNPNRGLLEIFHPARDIDFTMRKSFNVHATMQDNFIHAEEIAIIVADAVYERFNFCIDGMEGYMLLTERNLWLATILCKESTTHSMANELFLMFVDPVTGRVQDLIMNTPQSPIFG